MGHSRTNLSNLLGLKGITEDNKDDFPSIRNENPAMGQVALLLLRTKDDQVLEKLSSIESILSNQSSKETKPKSLISKLPNKIALFNSFYGAIDKAIPLYTKFIQPAIEAFIDFAKDKIQ